MAVRGYLTVLITQASSRTKANEVVWEDSFKEGFVKGRATCLCHCIPHCHSPLGDCCCSRGQRSASQYQGKLPATCMQHLFLMTVPL